MYGRLSPRTLVVRLLLCLLVFPLASAAQVGSSYRLGARDKVQVRVAELPDFDGVFEVGENGSLELPVIGEVEAQGQTESQLAATIRKRLEEEGLRRATVSLRITDFRSRPVSVLGAVVNPGNQFVPGRTTLLEVLLGAGGLHPDHGPVVQVRRRASNGLADHVEVSVAELFELGDPAVNLPIFAGDVIHVPRAKAVTVSFLGEVTSPGSVTFTGGGRVTLLIAIARIGGLSETASPKIRILRRQDGREEEIVANYRRIVAGRDADVELQDGDIVVVKESFF